MAYSSLLTCIMDVNIEVKFSGWVPCSFRV